MLDQRVHSQFQQATWHGGACSLGLTNKITQQASSLSDHIVLIFDYFMMWTTNNEGLFLSCTVTAAPKLI